MRVYFGTYSGGESKGIYVADFDVATGTVSNLSLAAECDTPSFLAIHPRGDVLYSVREVRANGHRSGAALVAWEIDFRSGRLTELGRVLTGSEGPCHVDVDPTGCFAAIAHYAGGSVTLASLDAKGVPFAPHTVQHQGYSGVDPQRQEGPHVHCVRFSPASELLLVTDLGLDRIFCYRYSAGRLVASEPPFAATAPGAGPRHMRFTPDGRWLLVINELSNSIASYRFTSATGQLLPTSSIGTLPRDFRGANITAEVCVHPHGRWIYGSNRGHDSIAIIELNPETGELTQIGVEPALVKTPRNFNLLAGGKWLMTVGQDSNTGSIFKVDDATGRLTPQGKSFSVPQAVCVLPIA